MTPENRDILLKLLDRHRELGISEQIDYDKIYLYSIIVHSTAIEGSTVTEVEAQLLFDEGITSSKRTMQEQMMNLDLRWPTSTVASGLIGTNPLPSTGLLLWLQK